MAMELPPKIENTSEFASMIKQLRLNHPHNGHIITAGELSLSLNRNKTWISQIESRRIKNIKVDDIISIYMYLMNTDKINAKECLKKDYQILVNKNYIIKQLLEHFTHIIIEKYSILSTTTEQEQLINLMTNINSGFVNNFNDFLHILCDFDFSLLTELSLEKHDEIINSFSDIKHKLNSYHFQNILEKLNQESLKIIDNINVSDRSMFDCMNFCKKCMAYISQLEKPEMETLLSQSGIDEINTFISALQKYTGNYFSYINFDVQPLQENTLAAKYTVFSNLRKYMSKMEKITTQCDEYTKCLSPNHQLDSEFFRENLLIKIVEQPEFVSDNYISPTHLIEEKKESQS